MPLPLSQGNINNPLKKKMSMYEKKYSKRPFN